MTTVSSAAARPIHTRIVFAGLAALTGAILGGCETSMNLFGPSGNVETRSLAPPPPAEPVKPRLGIAASIVGPSDAVGKQLSTLLVEALDKQRIAVAKPGAEKTEFTVRGYLVPARERAAIKITYMWDVTDLSGKRVNRINGEEIAPSGQVKDAWAVVTPQMLQTIAGKTAAALGAWLSKQPPPAAGGDGDAAPAGAGGPAAPSAGVGAAARERDVLLSSKAGPTTGSIGRAGRLAAIVPGVTGAPGDGSAALANALQRELSRNGIGTADRAAREAYRIEGNVRLGRVADGKQAIEIDWVVKDPRGTSLGTVSQKNEIDAGSLDGVWGPMADEAAADAMQGILKLLRSSSQS
ncbi:MAG: hypothetical protein ACREC6_15340 [Hyphomicrobiaceae bacterium]